MADKTQKVAENTPGKWYVDETCVPCQTCLVETPELLKYNDDEAKVYFFKQPSTPEEDASAQRALDVYPVDPIGNDGE